jgi:WD40 repeat protein
MSWVDNESCAVALDAAFYLVNLGTDGTVEPITFEHGHDLSVISTLAANDQLLAVSHHDRSLFVRDMKAEGLPVATGSTESDVVTAFAWFGKKGIFTGNKEGEINFCDVQMPWRNVLKGRQNEAVKESIARLHLRPDETYLASVASERGAVSLWDVRMSARALCRVETAATGRCCFAWVFSPPLGRYVAALTEGENVRFVDVVSAGAHVGEPIQTHYTSISSMCFLRKGYAITSKDDIMDVWSTNTTAHKHQTKHIEPGHPIEEMQANRDETRLITVSGLNEEERFVVWDIKTSKKPSVNKKKQKSFLEENITIR